MSQITEEGLQRMVNTVLEAVPTIVVHPEDEPVVRAVAARIRTSPAIEVNSWMVKPGNVMIFVGAIRPLYHLGPV